MDTRRRGMTLFELLIVITIVGIIYSIGIFTLKKETLSTSKMDLTNIKSTLSALDHTGAIRLVCDPSCRECRVWPAKGETPIASLHLHADGTVQRYGFDRNGDLKPIGKSVSSLAGSLEESCFEFTLYPDGSSTPILLKDNSAYYAYSPLTDDKPFITGNPDALRRFMFDSRHYPIKKDDYYAGQ